MVVRNAFDILGISSNCSDADVKKAYKDLARKWHPDKNPEKIKEAEEKFKDIQKAYESIKDSNARDNYKRANLSTQTKPGDQRGSSGSTTKNKTAETFSTSFKSSETKSKPGFSFYKNKTDASSTQNGPNFSTFNKFYTFSDEEDDILFSEPGTSFSTSKNGQRTKSKPSWNNKWNEPQPFHVNFNFTTGTNDKFLHNLMNGFFRDAFNTMAPGNPPIVIEPKDLFGYERLSRDQTERSGFPSSSVYDENDSDGEPQFPCRYCKKRFTIIELKRHEAVCKELKDVNPPPNQQQFSGVAPRRPTGDWRATHEQLINDIKQARKQHAQHSEPETARLQCSFCKQLFTYDNLVTHITTCERRPEFSGMGRNPKFPSGAKSNRTNHNTFNTSYNEPPHLFSRKSQCDNDTFIYSRKDRAEHNKPRCSTSSRFEFHKGDYDVGKLRDHLKLNEFLSRDLFECFMCYQKYRSTICLCSLQKHLNI